MKVVEHKRVVAYLRKRNLLTQYQKAKQLLSQNLFGSVALKERKPKSSGIWYFRINKKIPSTMHSRKGSINSV